MNRMFKDFAGAFLLTLPVAAVLAIFAVPYESEAVPGTQVRAEVAVHGTSALPKDVSCNADSVAVLSATETAQALAIHFMNVDATAAENLTLCPAATCTADTQGWLLRMVTAGSPPQEFVVNSGRGMTFTCRNVGVAGAITSSLKVWVEKIE